MRNFFLAFIVFLLWFIFALWYMTSNVSILDLNIFLNSQTIASETKQQPKKKESKPIENIADSISETNDILLNSNATIVYGDNNKILFAMDTLLIKKNVDSVYFNSAPEDYFAILISYLESNPNKEIIIHSDYSANEDFNTPNLGTVRGMFIGNILSRLGVNPDKVSVKSIIKDIDFEDNEPYFGGISFHVKNLSEIRLKEIEETRVTTKIVYPTFTFSSIIANKQFRESVEDLKNILEQYPNKKVEVIGHTDNIGSKLDNYEMALKYARQVRYYLIKKAGIPSDKITASSRGELNPIDVNTTKAGREKNRRIEFVIK